MQNVSGFFSGMAFARRVEQRLAEGTIDSPAALLDHHRKAAVLGPLLQMEDGWHLLFIRRSSEVQDHKGQVAFPGGAVEPQDENVVATALRESDEEVGLSPESVRILGCMRARNTITHYHITPVVAVIPWPFGIRMQVSEVSRVFTIPLHWLAVPEHHTQREVIRPNGAREPVYYFEEYDGELLWGITAAITLEFLDLIRE